MLFELWGFAFLAGAMLAGAHVALAVFNDPAASGPLTLITATLSPAKGVTLAQVNCRTNKNPEIEVEWTATSSAYATSYTVERATTSAGPYTSIASVAIGCRPPRRPAAVAGSCESQPRIPHSAINPNSRH
ncbi:MAG: hypothetical protein WB709_00980 [Solirubrobacteraceae bacterium]